MENQKFCLKWDNFQGSVTTLFDTLRQGDELVDITLCCEGQKVRAHKVMLSACSPYFRDVLKELPCQQMVFFLKDTSAEDLRAIVEFMYKGSVNVAQSQLASFIKTAETLQIRGLSGDDDKAQQPASAPPSPARHRPTRPPPSPAPEPPPPPPPPAKRRRISAMPVPADAQPPQVIDCTLSPDPEPAATAESPATPGGGLSSHSLPSPAPSPGGYHPVPAASVQRPFQQVGAEQHLPSTSAYDPANNVYQQQQDPMKVEKVEMPVGEEDAGLGSALEHVAEYEGGAEGYDEGYPSMEMGAMEGQMDPGMGAGGSADDGSQKGGYSCHAGGYSCQQCGKTFQHQSSVFHHLKTHSGITTCSICGRVSTRVANLRSHLRLVHDLSEEEVVAMVPTRLTIQKMQQRNQL